MKQVVIIGYSGHAYVVLDVLHSCGITASAYCEQEQKKNNPFDLAYLGVEQSDAVLHQLERATVYLGIGSNRIRETVFSFLQQKGIHMPAAVHQKSVISDFSKIGMATVVMPGAIINAMSTIGDGVICNTGSVIEHECIIADFVHIAPGAVLAGNVHVGKGSFIGANSVVKEGVRIGENVVIGAGSVVIRDVQANALVAGNPSKKIA